MFLSLNPLSIREGFEAEQIEAGVVDVSLNPLSIREGFEVYKTSNPNIFKLRLNPLSIREGFEATTYSSTRQYQNVLIP